MSDKHLGCGGCGALLVVVAPEKELSKEVTEIDSRLIFECPNWDEYNPDMHTRITLDLAKIIEMGRALD